MSDYQTEKMRGAHDWPAMFLFLLLGACEVAAIVVAVRGLR